MPRKFIDVRRINLDGSTQSRASLQPALVEEYADVFRESQEYPFPPIKAYEDGSEFYIGDGFHRVLAALAADYPHVLADVEPGTRRDAVLYACGANASHGARRTNEDKRRAVQILLADPEWSTRSDRWIAEACRVSRPLVASMRPAAPVTGRDGKTYPRPPDDHVAELPPGSRATTADTQDEPSIDDAAAPPTEDKPDRPSRESRPATEPAAAWQTMRDRQLAVRSAITHAQRIITQLAELEPEGRYLRQVQDRLQQHLKAAANTLNQTAPAATCPKCTAGARRRTCRYCLETGFITTRQQRSE